MKALSGILTLCALLVATPTMAASPKGAPSKTASSKPGFTELFFHQHARAQWKQLIRDNPSYKQQYQQQVRTVRKKALAMGGAVAATFGLGSAGLANSGSTALLLGGTMATFFGGGVGLGAYTDGVKSARGAVAQRAIADGKLDAASLRDWIDTGYAYSKKK